MDGIITAEEALGDYAEAKAIRQHKAIWMASRLQRTHGLSREDAWSIAIWAWGTPVQRAERDAFFATRERECLRKIAADLLDHDDELDFGHDFL